MWQRSSDSGAECQESSWTVFWSVFLRVIRKHDDSDAFSVDHLIFFLEQNLAWQFVGEVQIGNVRLENLRAAKLVHLNRTGINPRDHDAFSTRTPKCAIRLREVQRSGDSSWPGLLGSDDSIP